MNIVFAHFRSKPPKYLILNIKRTLDLFPEHRVYLITDRRDRRYNIPNLNVYLYNRDSDWEMLQDLLVHDKNFRNNFWFLSVARFLAIADFLENQNEEMLHVESDVILSSDFPFELLSGLNTQYAFPIVNNDQAISSCLYLRDFNSAHYLKDLTLSEAKKNSRTTDMHILRILSRDARNDFQILPTAPLYRVELGDAEIELHDLNLQAITLFKGVFDGVDIGMFLFGHDPRNNRGFTTLRNPTIGAYVDVSKKILSMNNGREFPNIYDHNSGEFIPVFSLHIHCKNYKLFDVVKSKRLIKNAVRNSSKGPRLRFYVFVFSKSLMAAAARRAKSKIHNIKSFFVE